MRRYVYDIVPGDRSRWIRLRDSGRGVTLVVKQIVGDGVDGTHEIEVGVDDFASTNALLGVLGFVPKSYQENRRTSFVLDGVQLEIDLWPHLTPYLEIEGESEADVIRVAGLLGCATTDLTSENTIDIYARHGIDLDSVPHLSFTNAMSPDR